MKALQLFLLLLCLTLFSCVCEEPYANTPMGNFEALWQLLDERYCFFDYKAAEYGLDWNAVREKYQARIAPSMTHEQLFEVCGQMLAELRDGHVNLSAAHNVSRYWNWHEDYPANFSDSLQRIFLGTDYFIAAGIHYRVLDDNIGYLYVPTFDTSFGSGNLSEIFRKLALCTAVIVDIRNNSGGNLTAAQDLAGCFTNERFVGGYLAHKTGKAHDAFSSPTPLYIEPQLGMRWQKPVAVLTNRRCYSAANSFVMFVRSLPNVTLVGDQTGGGAGLPFHSELPNGWTVRYSASPMYDAQMCLTEGGIAPDVKLDITAEDWLCGKDTILEYARRLLAGSK